MSQPRQVHPGKYVMATRRCVDRCFLLSPCSEVKQDVDYCLGRTMEKYPGISVVAWFVMSNHLHVIFHDRIGAGPKFMQELLSLIARSLNEHWKRREGLWSSEKLNLVTLHTHDDLLNKLVYVLSQSVDAGITERPEQWAGAKTKLDDLVTDRTFTVKRPSFFFSTRNKDNKAELTFRFKFGPDIESQPARKAQFLADLKDALERHTADLAAQRKLLGRTVIGMQNVPTDDWRHRPNTEDSLLTSTIPTFAAADSTLRKRLAEGTRAFRDAYREAQREWSAGNFNVMFPEGTYRMKHLPRRIHGKPDPEAFAAA